MGEVTKYICSSNVLNFGRHSTFSPPKWLLIPRPPGTGTEVAKLLCRCNTFDINMAVGSCISKMSLLKKSGYYLKGFSRFSLTVDKNVIL